MTSETLIDRRALTWKAGDNGRPPNYGSITYWLKRMLAERDDKTGEYHAQTIARAIIEAGKDRSVPHLNMVLERTDGAIASEVNIKGVMLHVGDEYAGLGLAAMRQQLQEYGKTLQESTEQGLLPQTGINVSSGENDPIKNDK